jgi:hypothetical protein
MNRALLALAALALAAAPAVAQQVTVSATTTGCFGIACVPTDLATFAGLSFDGSTFTQQTSSSGFLGIGGANTNFGVYQLDNTVANYAGTPFTLAVTFTAPPGIIPGGTEFHTLLQGEVNPDGAGGVQFDFLNNGPIAFNYADAFSPTNVLQLTVNDVGINPDQTIYGSGFIQTAAGEPFAVPGPTAGAGAIPLLLSMGLVWYRSRRRVNPVV